MSKTKNGGLGQYGAGPLEHQQFGAAGVEGVNLRAKRKPYSKLLVVRLFSWVVLIILYYAI